jgi:predicted kinase
MPKPKEQAGGRVVKMSPLVIARIEAELLVLAAELKARVPDLTPAKLQALKKRLRRAMGLSQ